jgi:minor extracellular serine protease Vpr
VDSDGMVSLFVEGNLDTGALRSLGAHVGTEVGALRTVRLPVSAIDRLIALGGLERAQLAQKLEPLLDTSVPETGANTLWGGSPPNYTGLSGRGVIVGIVDTGIDFRHQDFKTATGQTRILYLWDQIFTSAPPAGFNYGTEWTAAQINAGSPTVVDADGHGTFLAGIAAGNGRATGNGRPAYQYVGVAPEADLVVVKSTLLDTDVADGVNYIFQKAAALGRDAVVCIAVGTQAGAHDGTYPLEQTLNGLARSGRIICAAVGNFGHSKIHGAATSSPSVIGTVTFQIPSYTPAALGTSEYIVLEGWYNRNSTMTVTLRAPAGTTAGPVANGGSLNLDSAEGYIRLQNGVTTNLRGDKRIFINVQRGTGTHYVAQGSWQVQISSQTSSSAADFWIVDYALNGAVPTVETGMSYQKTVASPANADSVIAVGAYCTKPTWIAQNGSTYGFSGAVLGTIAAWSGLGPRRDAVQVPYVCAPGQGVGAARSANAVVSPTRILPDGVHCINYGTSAAAAHATGAVALLLQQEPRMSVGRVKSRLRFLARSDSHTGAVPNATWGYGKLHLSASPSGIGDVPPVGDVPPDFFAFGPPEPNPSPGTVSFMFSLRSTDVAQAWDAPVQLRIFDVRGRLVATIPGARLAGTQRLAWDGKRSPAGLYVAQLVVGPRTSVRKFVRIQP